MSATRPAQRAEAPSPERPRKGAIRTAMEEQVIIDHLPLADSIARKYGRRGPDLEDMIQVARMALVKAARRFEPHRDTSFVAFARPTISGEVKRYLRDCAWVVQPPRKVQDLHTEVAREQPALCQLLGREPTLDELAEHLGEDADTVAEAITSHNSLQPDSLDKVAAGLPLEDRLPDATADVFGAVDDSVSLVQALRDLDDDQKDMLRMRFFEDQSQQRIGDELGMTQVQVSRALARILVTLQQRMLNGSPDMTAAATTAAIAGDPRTA